MRIDRCVCTNQSFDDLVKWAKRASMNADQLADACGASQRCGMCRPYLKRAIETGQTVFYQLIPENCENV